MLTHDQIWRALDRLAGAAGLSPSGLAKRSGLDPTTFNKSKRITAAGRARWPSTESLAKALAATGTSLDTFVQLLRDSGAAASKGLPALALEQASSEGMFDSSGCPDGSGWHEAHFPALEDLHAYALEVSGASLEPVYPDGTLLVVSPSAPVGRGDRVVVRTTGGEMLVRRLRRRTPKAIELLAIDKADGEQLLAVEEVAWIARILWASQ
jgi:phage repressor protein C with HTH and peptisase S24 domain